MSRRPSVLAALAAALLALVAVGPAASALGTDPGLPQQWGLRQIGAPAAWSGGALVGEGVPIAIIDTGVDLTHEDLRDRIGAAVTCVDTGGDPAKCKAGGSDIDGHGSHVAGIAATSANNVGVSGVAPGAHVIAVRVFVPDGQSVSASSADINAGIRWVIRNVPGKGPINLSIGGDYVVTTVFGANFADGVEEAWAAGWLPVLASGNENLVLGVGSSNYGTLNALVVGATGPSDRVASYSSPTGSAKWAIVAPGGDAPSCQDKPADCILSTYKGGQYGFLQGTSMATPHVAGAAAVLMGAGLTNSQTVQRLLDTANPAVSGGGNCRGRLDLAKAAAGLAPAAAAAPATAPPSASPAPASPSSPPPSGAGSSSAGRPRPSTTSPAPAPAAGGPAPAATDGAPAPAPSTTDTSAADADAAPSAAADDGGGGAVTDLSISAAQQRVAGRNSAATTASRSPSWSSPALLVVAAAAGTAVTWRRTPR